MEAGEEEGGLVPALTDRFGRIHSYLRVSVTDRCNYRCVYCLPEDGVQWMPRAHLLTYEEVARVVRRVARMGVRRVRLTGGEPTVRRDLVRMVEAIAAAGVEDLSMTTNGHLFAPQAHALAAAGLKRVNLSLDTLDPAKFARLTRGGELSRVLAAIDAALDAGLAPVKINTVVMGGENDDEILALVARFHPLRDRVALRFIEYMPFEDRRHTTVPAAQLRARLATRYALTPDDAPPLGAGPARYWRADGLSVGFISPLTEHFCALCNRLRLQADGHLRTCLGYEDTPNLRDALRSGATDDALDALIRGIVRGKPPGHIVEGQGGGEGEARFEGVMTQIGG